MYTIIWGNFKDKNFKYYRRKTMRIFDRRFLQYQLAYSTWYNFKVKAAFLTIILGIVTFFTNNLIYIYVVPLIYFYGYGRLLYLFNLKDEGFYKRMEKQLEFYRKKGDKAQGQYVFQLEKILFEVELEKLSVKEALKNIDELLSVRPKMKKQARGILLSIYLVGKEEGTIENIPEEYIKHLDGILENEENPNALLDYARIALKLNDNQLAIKLLAKAREKNALYRKQRHPVYRSIYNTLQVAIPYYLYLALNNIGEEERAKMELEFATRISKSRKLRKSLWDMGTGCAKK